MKLWRLAVAVCAAMSATLSAQDEQQQTVDGAQRFLSIVASDQHPRFMAHYYAWPVAGVEYTITGAAAGDCSTQFTGVPFGYSRRSTVGTWVTNGSPGWSLELFERVRTNNSMPKMPVTVEWARVTSISRVAIVGSTDDGTRRNVLITWAGGFFTIYTQDDALAKRVEYAANFLKAACDKTAETGF